MSNKTLDFLGDPIPPQDALNGFVAFRKAEQATGTSTAPHVGKFPHAVMFTIKEMKKVLEEAENYLISNGVNDENERWMAIYFIISQINRPLPENEDKPTILLVGSKAIRNEETKEITAVDNQLERLLRENIDFLDIQLNTQPEIFNRGFLSYPLDLYDMGDRHPPRP